MSSIDAYFYGVSFSLVLFVGFETELRDSIAEVFDYFIGVVAGAVGDHDDLGVDIFFV